MKFLVFGASGQLGKSLIDIATMHNRELIGLEKKDCDVTDIFAVKREISYHKPDVVINAAAWTDVAGAEKNKLVCSLINTSGAINIASASKIHGASVIHISTDFVFDGLARTPISENHNLHPLNYYGKSKADAEILLNEQFLDNVLILRTAWLYSSYGRNFATRIIRHSLENPKLKLNIVHDAFGQPTSAHDLAIKIFELGDRRIVGTTLHATNSGATSWYEFAKLILRYAGLDENSISPISSSEWNDGVIRPAYSVLSHGRWEEFGIKPMQSWDLALGEAAPKIREQVGLEIGN